MMPPDCEKCRACVANPEKVRYNEATKNKGDFEMEERRPDSVPYIAHEAEMARIEREHDKERDQWNKERDQHKRTVRWLCSVILVLVLGLIGMFVYEAQFVDEVSETIEASTEGGGNAYGTLVSGDGSEVNYGTNESDANENQGP